MSDHDLKAGVWLAIPSLRAEHMRRSDFSSEGIEMVWVFPVTARSGIWHLLPMKYYLEIPFSRCCLQRLCNESGRYAHDKLLKWRESGDLGRLDILKV